VPRDRAALGLNVDCGQRCSPRRLHGASRRLWSRLCRARVPYYARQLATPTQGQL